MSRGPVRRAILRGRRRPPPEAPGGPVAALLLPILLLLGACTASTLDGGEEILTLEVAAETVPCVGEMEDRCLQVRRPGEDPWRLFYSAIRGFTHEEGTEYLLEVARRVVPDPPADGSSYAYRLVRILEERPGGP